jgi:hypothetical protein
VRELGVREEGVRVLGVWGEGIGCVCVCMKVCVL